MRSDAEYDRFLVKLKGSKKLLYRGIDITWASKYRTFCGHTTPLVRRSQKLPFLASTAPIGYLDQRPYRPSLSTDLYAQIDRMFKFFSLYPKGTLTVPEDITVMNNCLVQAANLHGIKTVVRIHGVLGQRHGFLPLTASQINVWDIRQANKLVSWGLDRSRIHVEGYGARYAKWMPVGRFELKRRLFGDLHIDHSKPILLVAPHTLTNFGEGQEDILRDSIEMIKGGIELYAQDYTVLVKLHPGSKDLPFWNEWVSRCHLKSWVKVIRDYDSMVIAASVNKAIIHHSTLAVDCMAFGTSCAIIEDGLPSGLEEYGEFFRIRDLSDFRRWVEQ